MKVNFLFSLRFFQRAQVTPSLVRLAICILVLGSGNRAMAAPPAASDTGYEIISQVFTPSLYWLDNNRLLFAGIKTADMQAAIASKEGKRVERLRKIYLWDDGTKSVRLHADAQSVCVANGIVHYTVRIDKAAGKQILKEGPFGSEEEIEKPLTPKEELSVQDQAERVHSKFTCRTHLHKELSPPARPGRRIIVLRWGHGYLDAGPEGTIERSEEIRTRGPGHIKLFRPGSSAPIDLPITLEQGPGNPIYSEYLGAYVTFPRPKGSDPGRVTSWPRGLPFTIYTFKVSGETTETTIPNAELRDIAWPQPTQAGWIFGGGNFYKSSGLYLFDKKAIKLDSGLVREIVVSPDGCRAAVAIQNKHLEMGTPTNLKVFKLCLEGQ